MSEKYSTTTVFRSLDNYKSMQREKAASIGVLDKLMAAKTLTQARIIVYGVKPKKYEATRTAGSKQGKKSRT